MPKFERKPLPVVDARKLGANCDTCPLKDCRPTAPQVNKNAKLIILAEAPGETEEDLGQFFTGAAGQFLTERLEDLGISWGQLHGTKTVLCRPKRKLSGKEWNQAVTSCQPRLARELSTLRSRWVFAVGQRALQALTGKKKLLPWVGSASRGVGDFADFSFVAAHHPSFLFRPKGNAYIPVFKIWLGRAWAAANGELEPWEWPKLVVEPPYAPWLKRLMAAPELSVDIENNPETQHMRCIGVGTDKLAVSVPMPGEQNAGSPEDFAALRKLLAKPSKKIFHNFVHDVPELEEHGYKLGGETVDTLLAHAVYAPQINHNLHLACAIEFHAPNWKSEFHVEGDDKTNKKLKRFARAPIRDLQLYNCKDNVMQYLLWQVAKRRLNDIHKGWGLYQAYLDCSHIAIEMTRDGVLIDTARLETHAKSFKRRRQRRARELRLIAKAVGKENWATFKIGSSKELHDLFFNRLHVKPTRFSDDTSSAKLDEKALGPLLTSPNPLHAQAARSLLGVRKWHKLLKTYVRGLPIQDDSLVHALWKVWGAVTGRWASSPNLQNIPKPKVKKLKNGKKKVVVPGLRDLFISRPGKWLIEADYSQLELRIIALLSGDELLLQWYAEGQDVHTLNARALFKVETPSKDQRDFAKTFVYAVNYGADAATIWQKMIIDFPNTSLSLIERLKTRWFIEHPWIRRWQEAELKKARETGKSVAPISGRTVTFHGNKVEPSKVYNHPVQSTGADIINPAVPQIAKALPNFLRMQVHDALIGESEEEALPRAMAVMRRYMEAEVELNGAKCKFPVDFKIGLSWAHMAEVKKLEELPKALNDAEEMYLESLWRAA